MNEIVNEFLLAGDKFMLEIHLREPGFSYSPCESVYIKCHFVFFLINWNMRLEIKFNLINFRLYTEVETENIKVSGFSIFKITEHWNSNLKFVFCFSF